MAYEEKFLSYLMNLEKDCENSKLTKLNYRSVNKKIKKNIEIIRDAFNNLGELFSCKVNNKQYNKRFLYIYRKLT